MSRDETESVLRSQLEGRPGLGGESLNKVRGCQRENDDDNDIGDGNWCV